MSVNLEFSRLDTWDTYPLQHYTSLNIMKKNLDGQKQQILYK